MPHFTAVRARQKGFYLRPVFGIFRSWPIANPPFIEITPEVLLKAYACGIFPMAESAEDPSLIGSSRTVRGIIPLDGFHVSSRLARTVRSDRFMITRQPRFRRRDRRLRGAAAGPPAHLDQRAHPHALLASCTSAGHCHSVEVYDGRRAGRRALRRALGRAFFGESMFHRARDASKVALVHLVARLTRRRLPSARHAVRDRPPQDLRRDRGGAARSITSCWKRR